MDDNLGMFGALLLLVGTLLLGGFIFGRHYEKTFWLEAIPKQQEEFCMQCARAGGLHD